MRRRQPYGELAARGSEIETHSGVKITYNSETSKFEAVVGNAVLERGEIGALRREITKRVNAGRTVDVMTINQTAKVHTVVGKEANNRWRTTSGELIGKYSAVYLHDGLIVDELERLNEEKQAARTAFEARYRAIVGRAKVLDDMPEPAAPEKPARILAQPRSREG